MCITYQYHYGKRRDQKVENPGILEKVPVERMTFAELADWYLDLSNLHSAMSKYTAWLDAQMQTLAKPLAKP